MRKDGIFDNPVRDKIRLAYGAEAMDAGYGQARAADTGGQRPVFSYHCTRSPKGKVLEKVEAGPLGRNVFSYEYDAAGHLTLVRKNEELSEYYSYNDSGLRIQDFRAWAAERRNLTYHYSGALVQAGSVHLKWSDAGRLLAIEQTIERELRRITYQYGNDSRLDRVLLADGTDVRYHYANELLPVKITVNGISAAEYQWRNTLQLVRYRDARRDLNYEFAYAGARAPLQVQVSGSKDALYHATGLYAGRVELDIFTDQVDSIRVLALPDGSPVKCFEYDSFGCLTAETRPGWSFPLGFACGLHDPWTSFVRFGFRDYDPWFGRFTAKDPIGYTGGDYDLWDYCVDDPVSCIDATGLESEDTVDPRPWWKRALAWYSPLVFGNDQERHAAQESLYRSMKKEVNGMASGFVDVLTITPKKIPTSVGIWGIENLGGIEIGSKLRESAARTLARDEQRTRR